MTGYSESQRQHSYSRVVTLLMVALVGVYLYCLEFRLPSTPFFIENDQLIFIYEGWRMSLGDVIYRDFFQFTFPGSQSFYALSIILFGTRFWILNATVVLLGCSIFYLTLRLSRHVIKGPFAYLPPFAFIFFGMRWFGLDGSHRMFSPVLILAAAIVALRARSTAGFALAGAFCAAASFFTQQKGLFALAAVVLFCLVRPLFDDGGSLRTAAQRAGSATLGFAITLVVLILPFAIAAGPSDVINSTLLYPGSYYSYDPNNRFSVIYSDLAAIASGTSGVSDLMKAAAVSLYTFVLPAVLIAALIFTSVRRKADDSALLLVALMGAALTFTTLAPHSVRLFTTSSFALITLAWLAAALLSQRTQKIVASAGIVVLLLLGVVQVVRIQRSDVTLLETPTGTLAAPVSPQTERYVFLSRNTSAGDTFFEVYEPFIYFPLQLRNPTRYGQIWPTEYTRPEHVAEALRDLENESPQYILWDDSYNVPDELRQPGDNTGPLADLVQRNYEPTEPAYQINGHPIRIWRRR